MKRRLTHVLLVDDSPDDNFFHRRAIRRSGIEVHVAEARDGKEALEHLVRSGEEGGIPQLIFLDINMPVMNGWEFLEAFDKLPAEIRVATVMVMLTTSPLEGDRWRAERSKALERFLNKPLTSDQFREIVGSLFCNLDADDG